MQRSLTLILGLILISSVFVNNVDATKESVMAKKIELQNHAENAKKYTGIGGGLIPYKTSSENMKNINTGTAGSDKKTASENGLNKKTDERMEEKAKKLEKKLDYFFLYCKQADLYGKSGWKHCIQKGKELQNDRLYKYTSPSHRAVMEEKMSHWSQSIKK